MVVVLQYNSLVIYTERSGKNLGDFRVLKMSNKATSLQKFLETMYASLTLGVWVGKELAWYQKDNYYYYFYKKESN